MSLPASTVWGCANCDAGSSFTDGSQSSTGPYGMAMMVGPCRSRSASRTIALDLVRSFGYITRRFGRPRHDAKS